MLEKLRIPSLLGSFGFLFQMPEKSRSPSLIWPVNKPSKWVVGVKFTKTVVFTCQLSIKWSKLHQQIYLFQVYFYPVTLLSDLLSLLLFYCTKIFKTFVFLSINDFLLSLVTRLLCLQKFLQGSGNFSTTRKKDFYSHWLIL